MKNNDLEAYGFKNRIINLILTSGIVLALIALLGIFYRDYPDNLGVHFIIECLFFTLALVVVIFQKKLSLNTKVNFLSLVFLLVLINALLNKGFPASAKIYIVLAPVLVSLVFSLKKSILWLIVYISVYLAFAFLYVNYYLIHKDIDANYYTNSGSWIAEAIILLLSAFVLIYFGNGYNKELLKKIKTIASKNEELEKYQKQLEELVNEKTVDLELTNEELKTINNELHNKNEIINNKNTELNSTIQHLKNTQAQLVQSEKMASLGILTAGVAHEINNPLNFIMGAYVGLESYYIENKHPEHIDTLLNSLKTGVDKASEIVQSLNQFSRQKEEYNEICDIHSIIENCIVMLNYQTRHNITIEKHFNSNISKITGNTGKLHQAIINILINAIQAINNKGKIAIRTSSDENNLTIEVIDTGEGITKENLPYITDPFFTTKAPGEGTGLGLSITYNIIQKHKGNIEFESETGKGTIARIILPLLKE